MTHRHNRRWLGATLVVLPYTCLADDTYLAPVTVETERERPGTVQRTTEQKVYSDTAELLKELPGASVNRNGPLTGIAQYRGLFGSRVNVLIDGINLKEVGPNSMDPPLSNLAPSLTENLKLYRGIAPVSSGIETIGGTIRADPRQSHFTSGEKFETHGVAAGGFQSVNDGIFGSLFASIANRDYRFHVSGSKEEGDDYDFEDNRAVRSTEYERKTASLGGGFRFLEDHTLGFNYSDVDWGPAGTPALPLDPLYVRGWHGKSDYKGRIGNSTVEAGYFYQDFRHAMDNFTLRPLASPAAARVARTEVDGGGGHLALTTPVGAGTLKSGFEFDQAIHDTIITNPNNPAFRINNFVGAQRDRYSIYAEWRGNLAKHWNQELGLRFIRAETDAGNVSANIPIGPGGSTPPPVQALQNRFNAAERNRTDDTFDAVAVLRRDLRDDLTMELGFARKSRAPSYIERYLWLPLEITGGLADGRLYVGDINLKPEVAYQFELGLEWRSPRFLFAPRAFFHHIDDYIQGVPSTDPNVITVANVNGVPDPLQYANIDARLYGVDIEWNYSLTRHWLLDGTLSFVRGERRDAPDNLYRIAPFTNRIKLNYLENNWRAGVETVLVDSQGDVSSFNSEQSTPGYVLFNLRGEYEPVHGLKLTLGVDNLLDQRYAEHVGSFNRVVQPDLAVGQRIPGYGRNVFLGANFTW